MHECVFLTGKDDSLGRAPEYILVIEHVKRTVQPRVSKMHGQVLRKRVFWRQKWRFGDMFCTKWRRRRHMVVVVGGSAFALLRGARAAAAAAVATTLAALTLTLIFFLRGVLALVSGGVQAGPFCFHILACRAATLSLTRFIHKPACASFAISMTRRISTVKYDF
jgi:fatty acid desaturase